MIISRTALPNSSLLYSIDKKYDYIDGFQASFTDAKSNLTVCEVAKAFLLSAPKWVQHLVTARNKIVGIFGLKVSRNADRSELVKNFNCEKGEQIGLFKVLGKSADEIILGEDDKHLNFRVSLFLERPQIDKQQARLTISTIVLFNNWLGRLYFLPVKPFHRFIVPIMMKGIIRQLQAQHLE
jgi:hypothetical protein